MAQKKRKNYKYKNIAAALAILLLIILAIATSGSSSNKKIKDESSSVADSSSEDEGLKLTNNYKYISLKNDDELGKGPLVLVNEKHLYSGGDSEDIVGVYDYLFDDEGNQIMQASSTSVKGSKQLLTSFSSLIKDFYKETKITNIVINTIYSDESLEDKDATERTEDSPEHATGYAIDLNTYNDENGSYPAFEATGNYDWIGQNCWKYGFVQRYTKDKQSITGVSEKTNHFRYVGQLSAEIMHKNSFCLEEYLDYIKNYTFEVPLEYQSENGSEYAIYYVEAEDGKTTNIQIPLKDDNTEYKYGYSGNNTDGYIVWVKLNDVPDESSSVAESSSSAESGADVSSAADSKNESESSLAENGSSAVSESTAAESSTADSKAEDKSSSESDSSAKLDDASTRAEDSSELRA